LSFEGRGEYAFALRLSTPSFELPTEVYFFGALNLSLYPKKMGFQSRVDRLHGTL